MKVVVLIFFLLSYKLIVSQTNILSCGYDMANPLGSASISVGQIDYIYFDGLAGFVSEGVQQPVEWLSTYNGGPIIEDLQVDIYPNPTLNIVNLLLENEMSFGIRIFSSTGQLVYASVHKEERSVTIDFSAYPVGPYLLEIIEHTTQTPLSISRIIRL